MSLEPRTRSVRIANRLAELERVRSAVQEFLGDRFHPVELNRIVLSVDEALANIIEHAYDPRDQEGAVIDLNMELKPDRAVFTIADRAPVFDPTRLPPPDMKALSKDSSDGGLGVFLFTTLMRAEHREREGGGNLLILEKSLPQTNPNQETHKA